MRVAKSGNQVLSCNSSGGECTDGTCVWGEQIALLSDKAAGCKNGQLCCKNITGPEELIPSPECKDKAPGARCDDKELMYCDAGGQCVIKCEFCAKNFDTEFGRTICYGNDEKLKKYFTAQGNTIHKYSCGCTLAECTPARRANGTCLPNDCLSTTKATDSNYMCCIRDLIPATTTP